MAVAVADEVARRRAGPDRALGERLTSRAANAAGGGVSHGVAERATGDVGAGARCARRETASLGLVADVRVEAGTQSGAGSLEVLLVAAGRERHGLAGVRKIAPGPASATDARPRCVLTAAIPLGVCYGRGVAIW